MRYTKVTAVILSVLAFVAPTAASAQEGPTASPAAWFIDVPSGAYYEEAVAWLVANGIATGTTTFTFSPNSLVNREQTAAFLWRRAGRPSSTNRCGYTDVSAYAYYAVAACWLKGNGIMPGTTSTTFSGSRTVTRGDVALFVWRAAGRPNVTNPHYFSDITAGSTLDAPARWLRSNGIATGLGSPYVYGASGSVSRAQMAVFLWRSYFAGEAKIVLSSLAVVAENARTGYDRNVVFGTWKDLDRNGCNTRCEVLARDKRFDLPGLASGGWLSVYDGVTTANSSSFDIDHIVPLAEAWDSGAWNWSKERWTQFGNDLVDRRSLRAVSATSNRAKGDRDPAEWMPSLVSFRCQYASEWVALKSRWSLPVDSNERNALRSVLDGCGSQKVAVIAAPSS